MLGVESILYRLFIIEEEANMKITFKQFLFSLIGLFFFSQAYSADAGSAEGQLNQTSEPAASKQEMAAPAVNADTKAVSKTQNTKLDTSPAEKSQEEMAGFSRGTVARSLFTTLIDNREDRKSVV